MGYRLVRRSYHNKAPLAYVVILENQSLSGYLQLGEEKHARSPLDATIVSIS